MADEGIAVVAPSPRPTAHTDCDDPGLTLDVDLMINKLLALKDNPGTQVQ